MWLHWVLVAAYKDSFPAQGSNLGSCIQGLGVLTTEQEVLEFKFYVYSQVWFSI